MINRLMLLLFVTNGSEDNNMDDANEYVDEVSSSVFPDDGNDSKVRITIFNFGGQAIFQNVQHLYMPRNSCYVIVST